MTRGLLTSDWKGNINLPYTWGEKMLEICMHNLYSNIYYDDHLLFEKIPKPPSKKTLEKWEWKQS